MKKKGLSNIIALVLIVLLSLAAVVLVWNIVVRNVGDKEVEVSILSTRLEIVSEFVQIYEGSSTLDIFVERKSGIGNLKGFIVEIEDEDGKIFAYEHIEALTQLQRVQVSIDYSSGGLGVLDKIRVTPVLISEKEEKEILGANKDEHIVTTANFVVECMIDADCDDSISCTDDTCVGNSCVHDPNDVNCADGLYCNGDETCNPILDCQAGSAPCSDDGVGCTITCDEPTDTCNLPDDSACMVGEICDPILDCIASGETIIDFEDFESGLGDWANVVGDDFQWTRQSGPTGSTGTGPNVDHTIGDATGFFVFTETSGPVAGDEAHLESLTFTAGTVSTTLTFWYHMYGIGMGSLHVDVYDGVWNLDVGSATGEQHPMQTDPYTEAIIDLSAFSGSIKIRFRGIDGPIPPESSTFTSDMALDDIEIKVMD
jgi:hypothetical protein